MKGLLSIPKDDDKKLPGILVVHENRGLNPYIKDVGRRATLDGYITLAPDALAPLGGYPGNDDEGRAMQRKRDRLLLLTRLGKKYLSEGKKIDDILDNICPMNFQYPDPQWLWYLQIR